MKTDGFYDAVAMTRLMPVDSRNEYWALMRRSVHGPRLTAAEHSWCLDMVRRYDTVMSEDEIESLRLGWIKHVTVAAETVILRRLTLRERAGWADPDKRGKLFSRYLQTVPQWQIIEVVLHRMALEKAGLLSNGHAPH